MKIDMSKILRVAHTKTKRIKEKNPCINYHVQLGIMISEEVRKTKLTMEIKTIRSLLRTLRANKENLRLGNINSLQLTLRNLMTNMRDRYTREERKNIAKDLINAYEYLELLKEVITKENKTQKYYRDLRDLQCNLCGFFAKELYY